MQSCESGVFLFFLATFLLAILNGFFQVCGQAAFFACFFAAIGECFGAQRLPQGEAVFLAIGSAGQVMGPQMFGGEHFEFLPTFKTDDFVLLNGFFRTDLGGSLGHAFCGDGALCNLGLVEL